MKGMLLKLINKIYQTFLSWLILPQIPQRCACAAPCDGGWALRRSACREQNDHQPPGLCQWYSSLNH